MSCPDCARRKEFLTKLNDLLYELSAAMHVVGEVLVSVSERISKNVHRLEEELAEDDD